MKNQQAVDSVERDRRAEAAFQQLIHRMTSTFMAPERVSLRRQCLVQYLEPLSEGPFCPPCDRQDSLIKCLGRFVTVSPPLVDHCTIRSNRSLFLQIP
jgi:hypothetical protein